jgi:hypothetical protein
MPAHVLQVMHRQAPGGQQHVPGVRGRHSPVTPPRLHSLRSNSARSSELRSFM